MSSKQINRHRRRSRKQSKHEIVDNGLVFHPVELTKHEEKFEQTKILTCQFTTLSGTKCKRNATFHINVIENGKAFKILPAPKSIDSCCCFCSQHLMMILGLAGIGLIHLLWKKFFFTEDQKIIYQGAMVVSTGNDFNAFKEIYNRIQTNLSEVEAAK